MTTEEEDILASTININNNNGMIKVGQSIIMTHEGMVVSIIIITSKVVTAEEEEEEAEEVVMMIEAGIRIPPCVLDIDTKQNGYFS